MKKVLIIIMILLFMYCSIEVYSENEVVTQTQKTKIVCTIDGLFIESYAVDGFMYLPVEKLPEYGFNIDETAEGIELRRNKIVYFDGCYDEKYIDGGLPVYRNSNPVTINGKKTSTFMIEDRIVIQADELLAFGDVIWDADTKTVKISIVINELRKAFEQANDKVRDVDSSVHFYGQKQDGEWNGIVETSAFQDMTYLGYMINGKYEGVVYGYRAHKPYLAALYELKTVRNGMKNGYCKYVTGYNNKPEAPGVIKMAFGIYENDRLKNGEYTVYTSYNWNATSTFEVKDFNERLISSTQGGYYEYEKSHSQVFYKGELIDFDVALIMENDRTLIPLRCLFEKMGAEVDWDAENEVAIVTKNEMVIEVKIDYYDAKVNNLYKSMEVPARLVEGRTMIPLRFLSEELGYTVIWNESENCIMIE